MRWRRNLCARAATPRFSSRWRTARRFPTTSVRPRTRSSRRGSSRQRHVSLRSFNHRRGPTRRRAHASDRRSRPGPAPVRARWSSFSMRSTRCRGRCCSRSCDSYVRGTHCAPRPSPRRSPSSDSATCGTTRSPRGAPSACTRRRPSTSRSSPSPYGISRPTRSPSSTRSTPRRRDSPSRRRPSRGPSP
jgi:hypothetical protein